MHLPTPQVHLELERGALPATGGTVRALLRLSVAFPDAEREREPLSLALVIDRSGSMSGPPLEQAKAAAVAAVSALRDGDRVTVIAYDHRVDVVVPSTAVGEDRTALVRAIEAIRAGNTTALHAGWVEGYTQVLTTPVASGLGRVVLLSDGLANVGLTDPAEIAADVVRATGNGVSTSTIGLGRHFDERMLRHLADAGQGSYTFVEAAEQLAGLFETELAGLSALRGRDVRLTWHGRGVRVVAATGGARLAADAVQLPDLVAGLPREALLTLEVAAGATLEGLRLTWDDVFTKTVAHLDQAIDAPTLGADAYAARPLAPAVAGAVRVAELAGRIADVERLSRTRRLAEAEATLQGLRAEVAAWPADAARDAQLEDLGHLLEGVRTRDVALASKRAYNATYERQRGVRAVDRRAMMS
ncbi:MAG: VWA domain-containing protein, partial [Trueperaceae bacterium]|nr:VWA domain-containing protein [Trueperaceae bacterium]